MLSESLLTFSIICVVKMKNKDMPIWKSNSPFKHILLKSQFKLVTEVGGLETFKKVVQKFAQTTKIWREGDFEQIDCRFTGLEIFNSAKKVEKPIERKQKKNFCQKYFLFFCKRRKSQILMKLFLSSTWRQFLLIGFQVVFTLKNI